jgi:hypothetical protein
MAEHHIFLKECFELSVFHEVFIKKRLLTKKMIHDIFNSVYNTPLFWGQSVSWGYMVQEDNIIDEMFDFWNQVGDVPFP